MYYNTSAFCLSYHIIPLRPMENLPCCPACNSTSLSFFLSCKDYTVSGQQFTVNQCLTCNLKFTNPRPSQADIGPYYESDEYISHSNNSQGIINSLYQQVRKYTVNQKVNIVKNLLSKGSIVLDYGAGTGYFLSALSKANYKTLGIEPNDLARAIAKKENDLDLSIPETLQYSDKQSINCITLWHVLEHVHALQETIINFHSVLTTNGYLIIAVPNADSFDASHYQEKWAAYDVPRHLYHFNQKSLTLLLSKSGFKHVKTKPMYFDSTYVSMLSEKYISKETGNKPGPIKLLKGLFWGAISNIYGLFSKNNYSSLIYIFQKS